jgi:hypothetical protein
MKAKNQLVVLSGILVLLATATIAATYSVMIVEAKSSGSNNFGQDAASLQARNLPPGGFGAQTSGFAHTQQPLGAAVSSCASQGGPVTSDSC